MKNVLVTGGCGFVGSAFIRYLFRCCSKSLGTVVNLDAMTYAANLENLQELDDDLRYLLVRGDIADEELAESICRTHDIDTIVHFAAESHVDRSIEGPLEFVTTNVLGTAHLLEVLRKHPDIHFHHVSTDEVYGSLGPEGLFNEECVYDPSSPYSASKAASDHMVRAYARTYGLKVTLSHCSNNYGPCQFPEKLIPLMLMNMVERKPLPIYGNGSNVRDWIHVNDHSTAIGAIITRGRVGETYDIGGNAECTNMHLVHLLITEVVKQTGTPREELTKLITYVKDRPGHDLRYAIDVGKIKQDVGWEPCRDLRDGLKDTVRWYLTNPGWLERIRLRNQ